MISKNSNKFDLIYESLKATSERLQKQEILLDDISDVGSNLPPGKPKKYELRTTVKKNYLDSFAVFMYQLGCSIVHFGLFVSLIFVQRPDLDKAK